MAKLPTYEEMAQEVAQRAIDECEYEGKTLREWIEIITAQHGTNLAEVGTDCISRQAAIDIVEFKCGEWSGLAKTIAEEIKQLPSLDEPSQVAMDISRIIENEKDMRVIAQPEIIRCKDCKYWDTTWQNDYAPNYHYCPMIDGTHRNDFYCADAERRSDE